MRVIEFIRLVARTRSESGGSRVGWKSACDYIARELILQQPSHVRSYLENAYRTLCERADRDAKVFVKAKKKRYSICKVAGCNRVVAQTSHFCKDHHTQWETQQHEHEA